MSVVFLKSRGGGTGCPLLAYRIVLAKLMTCEIVFGTICDARSIDIAKISMRYVTRHRMKVRHGPLLQLFLAAAVPQQQQMEYRGSIASTAGVAGAFTWPSYFYGAPVVYSTGEILAQKTHQ